MIWQSTSYLYSALDTLKLPAIVIVFGTAYVVRFRALEKRIEELNNQKEDKAVVASLATDIKNVSAREAAADNKLERRVSNMGLVLVALAEKEVQHEVIKGLKGE